MTDNIKVIFNDDDLHTQENLNPNQLKVFFGVNDVIPPCDPKWKDEDGGSINVDCSCKQVWNQLDGDNVSINVGCIVIPCDPTWKDDVTSVDFGCTPCTEEWKDTTTSVDFNVICGEKPENDLGTIRAYSGESATFTIYGLEVFKAYSGESVTFDLKVNQTIMPTMTAYSGESASFGLTNDVRIVSNVYNGEQVSTVLTTVPRITFNINSYSGEELKPYSLITNNSYDVNSYSGEVSSTTLTTFPSITFNVNAYSGETATTAIQTAKAYEINAYDGSTVSVDLVAAPNPNLEVNVYSGEYADSNVSISVALGSYTSIGEMIDYSLSTSLTFEAKIYDGSEGFVTFYESQNQTFNVNVLDGTYTNVNINTYSGFACTFNTGETCNVVVETDPYLGIPIDARHGESVLFTLSRDREISANVYTGETVTTVLDTREYYKLAINAYDGSEGILKPSYSSQMGIFRAYSGESVVIPSLDELPNWHVYSGESCEVALSTELNISSNSYSGEAVSTNIKYGEPVNLGTIRAYSGESVETEVKLVISTNFLIRAGDGSKMIVNDHMTKPYYIDLDKRKCCNYIDYNIKHIELNDAPYAWETYSPIGVCERMTVDLSSRVTFKINAYAGETFVYDNTYNTLEFRFTAGEYAKIPKFSTNTHIDLEVGNLIPESDNVVIEIDRPVIPPQATIYNMYGGETMVIQNFGVPYGLSYQFPKIGESVSAILTVEPAWGLRFNAGERCDITLSTNNQYQLRSYEGSSVRTQFYEPPWNAYSGETVTVELDTKSDYYAEFIDSGCLDNEYRDIDENGQPLPLEFNGDNVEGYKFLKFVQGRCY